MFENTHTYRPSGVIRFAGGALLAVIALSQLPGVFAAWNSWSNAAKPEIYLAVPVVIMTFALIACIRWLRMGAVLDNERLMIRKFLSSATFRLNEIGGIAIRQVYMPNSNHRRRSHKMVDRYCVLDLEGEILNEIDNIRLLRNYEDLIARVNAITAEFVAHYQASIAKE